jgi:hypothetical protein
MLDVKDEDPDAIEVVEPAVEGPPEPLGKGQQVGDKAFDDETDLKNEDFIFVY